MQASWEPNDTAAKEAANAWAREARNVCAEASGFGGIAVFSSYAFGDESLEQIFGGNLPRLLGLKQKWDPQNVFRWDQDLIRAAE